MRKALFIIVSTFVLFGCGHSSSHKDPTVWITEEEREARIALDFTSDSTEIAIYLSEFYPNLTAEQISAWESTNALEWRIIDGEKRYFARAGRNLFRIDKDAKAVYESIYPSSTSITTDSLIILNQETIDEVRATGKNCVNPVEFVKTYRLTVNADAVPAGETLRAWMPYPRTDQNSITDVKLIETSEADYIIAPDECKHKSIYMEKKAVAGEPTVFTYTFSFTSYSEWYGFKPEDVLPYDTESALYKEYTAERDQHVIFTDLIKEVTARVVGNETNPLRKANLIIKWIAANYPWASAREYSTIENIPMYVLENNHGDCGQVGLLYITMCRCAGVPARWQSGWEFGPGKLNLHDWAETYFEGIGWVPSDASYAHGKENIDDGSNEFVFYVRGLDAYRLIVNSDYGCDFYPKKKFIRSETVDFQRGEVEWKGGNLYFDQWRGWFDE